MIASSRRNCFWFGTIERSRFFPTPNSGADSTPRGWNDDGTLLNGGGYSFQSWGSHKQYIFEWPRSSASQVAQEMKSYADGSYGRGLIYFQNPNTFENNVLPAQMADPSMAVGYEGAGLVYGLEPTASPTASNAWDLPVTAAVYDLQYVATGFRGTEDAVFIPIPEGFTLLLGAFYSATNGAGVYWSPQLSTGAVGPAFRLLPLTLSSSVAVNTSIPAAYPGIWMWVGKPSSGAASVTIQGIIGRLIPADHNVPGHPDLVKAQTRPWIGGQGNSGCRFVGKPTYIDNHPNMVGFACTLKEVGFWSNG